MENSAKQAEIQEKRKKLIDLSVKARLFRDKKIKEAKTENEQLFWASTTLNHIIINYFYKINGKTEFNTFFQWKKQGATIKRGSHAYIIWGQPRKATKKLEKPEKKENQDPTEEEYEFWPICYLFSDKQVHIPVIPQQMQQQATKEVPFILD